MSKGVKKKGFTLVELVVVLAIFGLLASITGLGLYSWTRYSINKENNENARTIFLAAQESLTHMQASGTLGELNLEHVYVTEVDNIKSQNEGMDFSNFDKFSNRLYTAIYTPNNRTGIVYKILEPYLKDTGIFDGAIAIEFDPKDGVVYSVFYSKKATSFEYETDGNINESGVIGICKRDSGTLKDRLLGYYAADLTAAKPSQLPVALFETTGIPETDTQLLVNKEELYFRIPTTGSNIDKTKLKDYFYQVFIYAPDTSNHQSDPIIRLELNGNNLPLNGETVLIDYKAYYYKNGQDKSDPITIKLKTTVRDEDIKICFDAIDTNALEKLFNFSAFKLSYENGNGKDFTIYGYDNKFDKTLSIFNLLQGVDIEGKNGREGKIDFRNIYCRGYIYDSNSIDKNLLYDTTISNTEDILFSKSVIDNNECEIEIANMRHLFNISYIEQLNKTSTISSIYYKQVEDFSYKQEFIFDTDNTSDVSKLSISKSFPVLEVLSSESTYDGNEKVISDFQLNSDMVSSELSRSSDQLKRNTGIFSTNYGTIKNVQLVEANLISKIDDHGTDFTNRNSNPIYGSGIIVGVNEGTIEKCKVSGTISGYVNTGGLAGINKKTIVNCESSVLIAPQNEQSYNFGGLVGINTENNAIIKDSTYKADTFITLSMVEQENNPFENDLKGYHIGGIVGNLTNKSKLENCKTVSANEGYIIGYGSVGGIVGICDSTVSITSTYLNGERGIYNEANVIGVDRVGGVIANIANGDCSQTFSNLENKGAIVVIEVKKGDKTEGLFGGGIASYLNKNTNLNNCRSNVTDNETGIKEKLITKYSTGDYIGGLVGQQLGSITSDAIVEHKVLVAGNDYVGGLVGDNHKESDGSSQMYNQRIVSGKVYGDDYVGGLIGYSAKDLKNNEILRHTINLVSGDEYVGGLIGYNDGKTIENHFVDLVNIESITGKCGGLVGYNSGTITNYNDGVDGEINVEGGSYVGGLVGYNASNSYINKHSSGDIYVYSPYGDNIGGLIGYNLGKIENANIESNDTEVVGNTYVGGLIGYNDGYIEKHYLTNSKVTGNGDYVGGLAGYNLKDIKNPNDTVNNVSLVSGNNFVGGVVGYNNGYIEKNTVTNSYILGNGNFVGGIVGLNENKINLSNDFAIKTTVENKKTGGNYTGGIAGKNTGFIEKYYISYGNVLSSGDYTGGFIGFNEKNIANDNPHEGIVFVSGGNYAGGLAGDNRGTFDKVFIKEGSVTSTGNNSGGLFGYNSGTLILNSDTDVKVIISTSGNNVGGIAGENQSTGIINKVKLSSDSNISGNDYVGWLFGKNYGSMSSDNLVNNQVSVYGNNYVGGLVGKYYSGDISKQLVNGGSVTGTGDYIGGVFGVYENISGLETISHNIINTTVHGNNYVGGIYGQIISNNPVTISSYAESLIVTGNSFVGGVVPIVEKNINIDEVLINGNGVNELNKITLNVNNGIGGTLCAINRGSVKNIQVANSIINAISESVAGGISGLNERAPEEVEDSNNGIIENVLVETSTFNYGLNTTIGAISGANYGIIKNSKTYNNVFNMNNTNPLSEEINNYKVGEIVGTNGRYPEQAVDVSSINNCLSVRKLENGSEFSIDTLPNIVGLNLAIVNNTAIYQNAEQYKIDQVFNNQNIERKQTVRIDDIVKIDSDSYKIVYSGMNSEDVLLSTVYGIYINDGIATKELIDKKELLNSNEHILSINVNNGFKGIEIIVENKEGFSNTSISVGSITSKFVLIYDGTHTSTYEENALDMPSNTIENENETGENYDE